MAVIDISPQLITRLPRSVVVRFPVQFWQRQNVSLRNLFNGQGFPLYFQNVAADSARYIMPQYPEARSISFRLESAVQAILAKAISGGSVALATQFILWQSVTGFPILLDGVPVELSVTTYSPTVKVPRNRLKTLQFQQLASYYNVYTSNLINSAFFTVDANDLHTINLTANLVVEIETAE